MSPPLAAAPQPPPAGSADLSVAQADSSDPAPAGGLSDDVRVKGQA